MLVTALCVSGCPEPIIAERSFSSALTATGVTLIAVEVLVQIGKCMLREFDTIAAFEVLSDSVKVVDRIKPNVKSQAREYAERYRMEMGLGDRTVPTTQSITVESIDFRALEGLASRHYLRTVMLGKSIQSGLVRTTYLLAVARGVLKPGTDDRFKPQQAVPVKQEGVRPRPRSF